ncbi:hypothetical protein ACFOTA_10050 [Chitinophaga sp. GCM10012297]|uniref:Uncharacterized protein n=1 Tax=Chitinophaga chungangae TaxID=2821488 RepID=A0ABS3YCY6_9BACT|nr:hypothetical protein [Chitinophaga chungangae]MBO9152547.1 hypothetical protein [Chitinophaga chungangae]
MEPFSVTLGDQVYEITPYVKGYSVSFHIDLPASRISFELDEEDNLRAVTSGEPVAPSLIGQLADAIVRHFA